MRTCLFLLLLFAGAGCNNLSSEKTTMTDTVMQTPPTATGGPRAIITDEEDFYKEMQGKWMMTTDSSSIIEVVGRTISLNGGEERMPFTVSWDACNDELKAAVEERYAGEHAIYLTMESNDGTVQCAAMLEKTPEQFTLSDEEGRSEATYRKLNH